MSPTYPIVSSLVLIVNPVQAFIRPVLYTVLCHPLIYVTASLGKDTRNHLDLLQIYLEPLATVLILGKPSTPARNKPNYQEPSSINLYKKPTGDRFLRDS